MSEPIPNNTVPTPPADELLSETGALPIDIEPQKEEEVIGEKVIGEGIPGETVVSENVVSEKAVDESIPVKESKPNEKITLTTDKSTLTNLAQNLNTNLLVTVAAYKTVLVKIKENTSDVEKQKLLEENIKELETIENFVTNLLVSMQTNLEVEPEKMINASNVLEEAGTSNQFVQKLFNAEAIAILAAMLAPIGLGGGGKGKSKSKKKTRRKRNKGNKTTKRSASKI